MEKNFDYDDVSDSLIISRKQINDKVQGSAEIGNLILDFTNNGKIVNVEFQNISKFLEIMNVNPSILNELTEVNLIVQKQRAFYIICLIYKANNPKIYNNFFCLVLCEKKEP